MDGESQRASFVPLDAESTAPTEDTGPPPALLEPLLSHTPEQPGAGPGFTSLSQDKQNQKLPLKLTLLSQVTKLLISACPQSLEKNCHYSDSLQAGG